MAGEWSGGSAIAGCRLGPTVYCQPKEQRANPGQIEAEGLLVRPRPLGEFPQERDIFGEPGGTQEFQTYLVEKILGGIDCENGRDQSEKA